MLLGNVTIGAGPGGALFSEGAALFPPVLPTLGGFSRFSSLELQLEIPKAASSESTAMVKATRAGLHRGCAVLVLFLKCIYY
ncbi:MAG: hypothetical protein M3Y84_10135 [Acidobacteriota bacterium]|nr:hypothetical protein [Acidobacteriota bacterium]